MWPVLFATLTPSSLRSYTRSSIQAAKVNAVSVFYFLCQEVVGGRTDVPLADTTPRNLAARAAEPTRPGVGQRRVRLQGLAWATDLMTEVSRVRGFEAVFC